MKLPRACDKAIFSIRFVGSKIHRPAGIAFGGARPKQKLFHTHPLVLTPGFLRKGRNHLLHKFLNIAVSLLVLLLPTQLAYHFWPTWSYIRGIRVDYLSPTIYATEILITATIVCWVLLNKNKFIKLIRHKLLALFSFFCLINVIISINHLLSLFLWLKIFLLVILAIVISNLNQKKLLKEISKYFYLSIIYTCLIAIGQFINQGSLGGIFYWMGERSFSTQTPGIALGSFFGHRFLRPYATLPHPNALSGYLLIAVLTLIYLNRKNLFRIILIITYALVLATMLITYSKTVYVAVGVLMIMIPLRKKISKRILTWYFVIVFLISLVSPWLVSGSFNFFSGNNSLNERLTLIQSSIKIIGGQYVLGIGKGNFIVGLFNLVTNGKWLTQPVHNAVLLLFVEGGLTGVILLYYLGSQLLNQIFQNDNYLLGLILVAVLTISLTDHYWLTLYQNQLLLAFCFGIFNNKSIHGKEYA